MYYEVNQYYSFPTTSGDDNANYIYLEVTTPDGSPIIVSLEKLEFQKRSDYKLPLQLKCKVRSVDENGIPLLGHSIAAYVKELYSDSSARDESFECTVMSVPANPLKDPYDVRDGNGIFFRVNEHGELLSRGQKIRCKIKFQSDKWYQVSRWTDGSELRFIQALDLLGEAGVAPLIRPVFMRMLQAAAFADVRREIGAEKGKWPLTAANIIIREKLDEWFVALLSRKLPNVARLMLDNLKRLLLYLLESSNYLSTLSLSRRHSYQELLTGYVERFEPYNRALKSIQCGGVDKYIDNLFDKLHRSGYLYHPRKQLGELMIIFRLYPDKVSSYLNRIFESIFSRDLENWKQEPFRSAFIEQIQIYVEQACEKIDELPVVEKREQKLRVETTIISLALEILLAGGKATSTVYSQFYRYISLLRPACGVLLLEKSLVALLNGGLFETLKYSTLREPMMLMTQASVSPANNTLQRLADDYRYSNGIVDIIISQKGISILRSADRELWKDGALELTIPNGMMKFRTPQIYVNGISRLSASKIKSLPEHSKRWKEIEMHLFESAHQEDSLTLRDATEGEDVYIVVDDVVQTNVNDQKFLCHIQDEGYKENTGYLQRSEIVGYKLTLPDVSVFQASDGSQLGFYAHVIKIDENGQYVFSLIDRVREYATTLLNSADEYVAVVTGRSMQSYTAICRDGIGLFLTDNDHQERKLMPGTVVHCRLSHKQSNNVIGNITDSPVSESDHFGKAQAFANLINAIGEDGNSEEPSVGDDALDDNYEYLGADKTHEIVEILRFYALANRDMIIAYNYLRFARLIALAIGEDMMAERLLTHCALLEQLQYFAVNSQVDSSALEQLREQSKDDALLSQIYHRIELVSWLEDHEHDEALFKSAKNPETELEGALARMVLSYNMLHERAEESSLTGGIKQQIMAKLNINSETKTGTYYGSESKYVEFKTSLVYVASSNDGHIKEDPNEQQSHILSRIAGMLNADGGTLYIGVNNDGYAVGLHDDFQYYKRHRLYVGSYPFDIKDMDGLCVFLENLVNETFGETIARKIEIRRDDKSDKDVIAVLIKQSLTPVYIGGHLYVRQSGQSTREYTGRVLEDFLEERKQQKAEQLHAVASEEAETTRLK